MSNPDQFIVQLSTMTLDETNQALVLVCQRINELFGFGDPVVIYEDMTIDGISVAALNAAQLATAASAAAHAALTTTAHGGLIHDAASDGKTYGRKDAAWEQVMSVPVGGIIGMSGLLNQVLPTGFAVCNGTDNAPGPDLTSEFVI